MRSGVTARTVRALLLSGVLALAAASGCVEKDPYEELVSGEDLGTGVTLQTKYSDVPAIIAANLGKNIAERNASTDFRYYEFTDTYFDYAFIIADLDQNRRVDAVLVVVYAVSGDRDAKIERFSTVFPKVRTKTGITIGSTIPDVTNAYQTPQEELRDPSWINSKAGHLHFVSLANRIEAIWLVDDANHDKPLSNIVGRNLPEGF